MKFFIFTITLIACLMLVQSNTVDEIPDVDGAAIVDKTLAKSVSTRQCKSIGNACNLSEDCCTLRCSSYLKRCVS